ncbi:MAG TPA: hypothetical protein VFU97_24435 [Xanthobacteraceae bacterium]|nr:hypothetical protein [Xanthobacteraceae bacterium]
MTEHQNGGTGQDFSAKIADIDRRLRNAELLLGACARGVQAILLSLNAKKAAQEMGEEIERLLVPTRPEPAPDRATDPEIDRAERETDSAPAPEGQ